MGQLLHQGRHVGTDRHEHLWILKGKTQCSVAAHGNAGYGAGRARVDQAKSFFHLRNEITHEKIFILRMAALGVDVEAGVRSWSNHHEFANLLFFLKVFNDVPCAAGDEESMVAAQTMKKVQYREFLVGLSVITGRQQCAVANGCGYIAALEG